MADAPRPDALAEVVDLIPDVLFRCHKKADGKIYWSLNEGGLAREMHLTTKEIEGKSLDELFPGGASDAIKQHFEAAFAGETEPFINELGGRFFKHFPQPVFDDAGNVVEVVGFISEVTELVLAQRALEQANQDLDAFAHSASHDLQLPLTVLSNLVQMLERGADAQAALPRMRDTVRRMSTLVDALLAFSRGGTSNLQPQSLDITAMAQDIVADLQAREPHRAAEWHIEEGLQARGDPAMMRVVLENLLSNAWKYTRLASPAIIRIYRDGDLVIEDNGIGLPQDTEALFRPFVRAEAAAKGFEGNGIGLATVRRIMERHGGMVRAERMAGHGARFHLEV